MSHEKYLYTKSHEWIEPEGDVRLVGISDHAQHQLGDIVFVEVPEVGKKVAKGEELLVVESPKAAAEVYAPMSGEVVEVNEALEAEPGTINQGPYGDGWLVKLRITNPDESGELLAHDDYLKLVEG